ncbi:hypothetical protein L3Y34_010279 [Caenorhabditis briggsae]|uniref:Uncharacterized protein n=4 Tax=Caenorhabditis briggsae TaxID=6238 RepID=A0AAE9CSH2_CAEBR|nr:hypothetical protein L3Y34_010279 [Caenorhabditis briggsae]
MLLLLLLAVCFIPSIEKHIAACIPRCEMITMNSNMVPSQYNRCVCDLVVEEKELGNLSHDKLNCVPNFRSLKFRNKETGAVMIHKAVVDICYGMNGRIAVDQTQFDAEEQEFRFTRNFRVATVFPVTSISPAYNQKHSWIDDFRSNIMQLYRKPDGHLRFG